MADNIFGVTGQPILHSRSPELYRTLSADLGLSLVYMRLAADTLVESLALFEVLELKGMNVTAPFKAEAMNLVEAVSDEAGCIEAANCIYRGTQGNLVADNTDARGMIAALEDRGLAIQGMRALIIGAGGAGRAAAVGLARAGAAVTIANRSVGKAAELAMRCGGSCVELENLARCAVHQDLIVNTVASSYMPDPRNWLSGKPVVFDADYKIASLYRFGIERGLTALSGLEWLTGQGLIALRTFTGAEIKVPQGSIARIAESLPRTGKAGARRRRLCLIGLMGSGKTSVCRLLSEALGLECIDSDLEIEKDAGMSIAEIFRLEGESGFRTRERRLLDKVLGGDGEFVLATGGGMPVQAECAAALARECLVIWLHVNPSSAALRASTLNRPLLLGVDAQAKLRALERERRLDYARISDLVVSTDKKSEEKVARAINAEVSSLEKNGG